jgi:hypothetical protein
MTGAALLKLVCAGIYGRRQGLDRISGRNGSEE